MPRAVFVSGLLCCTALVLTSLCLFAGSREGFLDEFAVITLKTTDVDASLSRRQLDSPLGRAAELIIPRNVVDDALGSAQGAAENVVAEAPHLRDFYSIHLLNFCEGDFGSKAADDSPAHDDDVSREVTSCSSLSTSGALDLRAVLEQQLGTAGKHLLESAWPDEIDRGLTALQSAQRAMVVLYIMTIIFMILSVVVMVCTRTVFPTKRSAGPTIAIILLEVLSTSTLGLASALLTDIVFKTSQLVSSWGSGLGISSTRGDKIVILTWSAWLVVGVATTMVLFFSRCGRRSGL